MTIDRTPENTYHWECCGKSGTCSTIQEALREAQKAADQAMQTGGD